MIFWSYYQATAGHHPDLFMLAHNLAVKMMLELLQFPADILLLIAHIIEGLAKLPGPNKDDASVIDLGRRTCRNSDGLSAATRVPRVLTTSKAHWLLACCVRPDRTTMLGPGISQGPQNYERLAKECPLEIEEVPSIYL